MNKTFKFILGVIAVFGVGLLFGFSFSDERIRNIQGYMYDGITEDSSTYLDPVPTNPNATNANATNANATDANATSANATDCNATDANATNANATSGNYSNYDYQLYLNNFRLHGVEAFPGDKVYLDLDTTGAMNTGASINFESVGEIKTSFTVQVKDLESYPYIIIPSNVATINYKVSSLLLVGRNSDDTTFSKHYSARDLEINNYDYNLKIKSNNKCEITKLRFDKTSVKAGENVYVDLGIDVSAKEYSVKLHFYHKTSDGGFNVNAESDSDGNIYFKVPSWVELGDYELKAVTVHYDKYIAFFTKEGSDFDEEGASPLKYNISLKVLRGDSNDYEFVTDDLNNYMMDKIRKLPNDANIIVDVIDNSMISKELFDAIKGTNRKLTLVSVDGEMVFEGKNINNSQFIDAKIEVTDEQEIKNELIKEEYLLVHFAANGSLPGKALVRINKYNNIDLGNKVNVYYYHSNEKKFSLVAKDVELKEDYYEFEIDHNSDYIITKETLDEQLLVKEKDNVVDFQKSDKTLLLIIIIGILIIIIAIIVIKIVGAGNKNEDNNLESNRVDNTNEDSEIDEEIVEDTNEGIIEEANEGFIEETTEEAIDSEVITSAPVNNNKNNKKKKKYKKR